MTALVDPAVLECARRELEQPTLPATRLFVRGPCPIRDGEGRPAPARALAAGADGALVWFVGAQYPLNLAVELERGDGGWRVVFAQADAHARVALRIQSAALAPDALTAALGLAATREAPAGRSFDGREPVARREHLWIRDVLPDSPESIEEKLNALLAVVEPRRAALTELVESGQIAATVSVAYHADVESMQGVHLSTAALRRLGALGLELDLDLYAETLGTPPSAT